MKVVYRGLAVAAVVLGALAWLVPSLGQGAPEEGSARPVAAPSAVPSSSGSAVPSVEPSVAAGASPPPSASPTPGARPAPTKGARLAPGYTAMEALQADPRVPGLPERLPLKAAARLKVPSVKDSRSGLLLPRLGRPWSRYGSGPFETRQVIRGTKAMFVTAPVPIEPQREIRDTALLTARWTLNHHPKGARIRWVASQRVSKGWLLVYRVVYGRRSSLAAVAVVDGGGAKPGMAFVTVPDSRKSQWRHVARIAGAVRAIGSK